ncbi:MAG: HI0074 family nucleotidyltransferase substrate-binding subunit [Lachnospiraceae bacterium]|nr:HI0074 family nucleotidyltransferase substrate-binding subunit [Lachnospiraceae bacterium]
MENQFINRYNSFCKSLDILHQSCAADPKAMFVLGATARAYNLTFDLSWKVMKDILIKYFGIQDFATGSPRESLRTSYQAGLISDDMWLEMLRVRNTLSHDYNGEVAMKYFHKIVTDYFDLFLQLKSKISKYYENGLLETAEKFSELN